MEISGGHEFRTTRWSVVVKAGDHDLAALETLCKIYWIAAYAHARRKGYSPHDAEDLTQGFFNRNLHNDWVKSADQSKGNFRTYLLSSLNHYMASDWRRETAAKRGGRQESLCLDGVPLEEVFQEERLDCRSPEAICDQQWARATFNQALGHLEAECKMSGKTKWFEKLQSAIIGEVDEIPYANVANSFGVSVSAVKSFVNRARKRLGDLLRLKIRQTVKTPKEIDEELRSLISVLKG